MASGIIGKTNQHYENSKPKTQYNAAISIVYLEDWAQNSE